MHHHITGLPVVDDEQRVVGVVSDYDLLSLDAVSGKMQARPLSTPEAFIQRHRGTELTCRAASTGRLPCMLSTRALSGSAPVCWSEAARISVGTAEQRSPLSRLARHAHRSVWGAVQDTGFFPRADTNWEAFHEVQRLVIKNAGKV